MTGLLTQSDGKFIIRPLSPWFVICDLFSHKYKHPVSTVQLIVLIIPFTFPLHLKFIGSDDKSVLLPAYVRKTITGN